MYKKLLYTLVYNLLLLGMSPAVQAAESVELTVQATAVTGACTPILEKSVLNFGKINYTLLNDSKPTQLPEQTTQLTISCTSPMTVGWTVSDNRTNFVAKVPVITNGKYMTGDSLAGIGSEQSGLTLGNWTFSVGNEGAVHYNGAKGVAISSHDGGSTWSGMSGVPVAFDFRGATIISISDKDNGLPVPLSLGIFNLNIGVAILPRSMLKLTDDTKLDGSATISLIYL